MNRRTTITLAILLLASLAALHAADAGGPVRSFDPELWVSPDGRMFYFWAQMEKGRREAELGVWCIESSEPDAAQPQACWFPGNSNSTTKNTENSKEDRSLAQRNHTPDGCRTVLPQVPIFVIFAFSVVVHQLPDSGSRVLPWLALYFEPAFLGGVVFRRRFSPSLAAQLGRVGELDAPEQGEYARPCERETISSSNSPRSRGEHLPLGRWTQWAPQQSGSRATATR